MYCVRASALCTLRFFGKGSCMDIDAQATQLLRKLGWDASNWAQIEAYARMSPVRKVEQMFRLRRQYVGLLAKQLRAEHPDSSD